MKIKKSQISNFIFLIAVAVILFTPIGAEVKVWVNRIISFSPSVEDVEDRTTLNDYNWQLQDLNGNQLDFESLKGKVVLVNFWATWCPPCRAEMPSLQSLYNDYKDKVAFVLVSHEKTKVIQDFLAKNSYDFVIFNKSTAVPKVLERRSIPVTFVIDKKGSIVIDKTGAADWNSQKTRSILDQLLAE